MAEKNEDEEMPNVPDDLESGGNNDQVSLRFLLTKNSVYKLITLIIVCDEILPFHTECISD